MKHCLLALAAFVGLGAFAAIEYDEFTQNMGVVSVLTNGQNALPSGKIFVAKPTQNMPADEWSAYRKCLTFCLIDAGYDIASSPKEAVAVVQTEWVRDDDAPERPEESIATYNICIRVNPTKAGATPLVYMARTIVSPDGGGKAALVYTCAALLDNGALASPHEIDFWISLDDVAFKELPSVTAMKFLAE